MTITVTDNAATTLTNSLQEQEFWENGRDGFWYPKSGVPTARARIKIDGGIYAIQTRHGLEQPWTLLVKALVSDFDPATFRRWIEDWPLQFS